MLPYTELQGAVTERDKSLGNKALNLKRISEIAGIVTPRGVALLPDASQVLIRSVSDSIRSTLSRTADPEVASRQISEAITGAKDNEIREWWLKTESELGFCAPYAVRSSGHPVTRGQTLAEDSAANSLAGQYSSFLNVESSGVVDAIKLCIASLFNVRSIELFDLFNDSSYLLSRMTVLVQEMVQADVSGVAMTVDPIERDPLLLGVEGGCGPCSQFVDGSTQGDFFLMDKRSGEVVHAERGRRSSEFCRSRHEVDREASCFSLDQLRDICIVGSRIERHYGSAQDIEFAFTAAGQLAILQVRPITTPLNP